MRELAQGPIETVNDAIVDQPTEQGIAGFGTFAQASRVRCDTGLHGVKQGVGRAGIAVRRQEQSQSSWPVGEVGEPFGGDHIAGMQWHP